MICTISNFCQVFPSCIKSIKTNLDEKFTKNTKFVNFWGSFIVKKTHTPKHNRYTTYYIIYIKYTPCLIFFFWIFGYFFHVLAFHFFFYFDNNFHLQNFIIDDNFLFHFSHNQSLMQHTNHVHYMRSNNIFVHINHYISIPFSQEKYSYTS